MKYPLLILSLLFSCSALFAQEGRLAAFSADRLEEGKVEVKWTMKAGVSCQSPEVQISTDSLNFSSIYRYPGVCGGGATEESFSWIHTSAPISSDAYYRLKIDEGEFSKVVRIPFDPLFLEGDVVLFPNPGSTTVRIAYQTKLGKLEVWRLYDSKGAEVFPRQLRHLAGQYLEIEVSDLERQQYFIELIFESGRKERLKFLKE